MNKDQIEFNILLGQNRKNASIKECLRGGADCSGKIVQAHSIQRGKILASIAEGSAGEIYHLGLVPSEDMTTMVAEFKREGIKKFSTFSGFCGGHDKAIFQPIEDVEFTAENRQLDIYAYRAAAKELHANLESRKMYENLLGDKLHIDDFPAHFQMMLPAILRGEVQVPDFMLNGMLQGAMNHRIRMMHKHCDTNISELRLICDDLIGAIDQNQSSNFEHIYHYFDGTYPIACCSSFIPYFDHNGSRIISEQDVQLLAQSGARDCLQVKTVFLNVFPENNRTHVIFTFSKENHDFKGAMNSLLGLNDNLIKLGLSNIIINYSENTAFSPRYIEDNFKEDLIISIKDTFSSTIVDPMDFRVSNINLFIDAPSPDRH